MPEPLKVRVKKLNELAVLPKYSKPGDAGLDLVATSKTHVYTVDGKDKLKNYYEYGTGLAFEIPEGYVGLIFPRSSISDTQLMLTNSVGVIDASYRGEVKFRFKEHALQGSGYYKVGDRIGQMVIMPFPKVELEEAENLTETERGNGGFGHTGA